VEKAAQQLAAWRQQQGLPEWVQQAAQASEVATELAAAAAASAEQQEQQRRQQRGAWHEGHAAGLRMSLSSPSLAPTDSAGAPT